VAVQDAPRLPPGLEVAQRQVRRAHFSGGVREMMPFALSIANCGINDHVSARRYDKPEIRITENGVSGWEEDTKPLPGVLNDTFRQEFYR
jgi:hypothetical protein